MSVCNEKRAGVVLVAADESKTRNSLQEIGTGIEF